MKQFLTEHWLLVCENATDVNQKIAFNACLMVIDNLIAEVEG